MAVRLRITLEGGKALEAKLGRSRQVFERGIRAVTMEVEGDVKEDTPIRTGRLRSSIKVHVRGMNARLGTDVNYAPFVEFDTKKHEIKPKRGGVLAWPRKAGRTTAGLGAGPQGTKKGTGRAGFIYARAVQHPGTTGAHMFRKRIDDSSKYLRIYRDQVARWLRS